MNRARLLSTTAKAILLLALLAFGFGSNVRAAQVPQLTIIDQTAETLAVFGRSSCTKRSSNEWVVWHQIVNSNIKDGVALAQYFKTNRGWDAPGYSYLLDDEVKSDGTVKIWQLWPEDCGTYGVGENYNFTGIHIAYVDNPSGSPPSDAQLATLKLLTAQKMQQYGIDANHIVSHAETALAKRGGLGWSEAQQSQWYSMGDNNGKAHGWKPLRMEIPAACDNLSDSGCVSILNNPHSDPVGVDMDAVRVEMSGSALQVYVNRQSPLSNLSASIKAAAWVLPCLVMAALLMALGSWLAKDPVFGTKAVLAIYSKYQGYKHRREMLRELKRAQEKRGFFRIGLPAFVSLVLIFGGFQLGSTATERAGCYFQPVFSQYDRGDWEFGEHTYYQDFHTGVDPMAPTGTSVPSSATGKVVWASWWPGDPLYKLQNIGHGNTVVVETYCGGKAWYHFYAHLSEIDVKVGQKVEQGDIVGKSGMTGAATGPHLHFAITDKGPTEEHVFSDWRNPDTFVEDHSTAPVSSYDSLVNSGLKSAGWIAVLMAFVIVMVFDQGRGLFSLLKTTLLPGAFFAGLILFVQLGPILSVKTFDWSRMAELVYTRMTQPVEAVMPILPAPQFQGGASTSPDMQELPAAFIEEIKLLGPQVIQIAREENVPPEALFTLWLKESGGRRVNPPNGEGLCGFYSRVQGGRDYFIPGPITEAEVLRQLRECAKEFHVHNRTGTQITFETTDFDVLGPTYMAYNGNLDCHGGQFASWRDHPYVMNGYDGVHQGMIARSGNKETPCVALKIIGAVPAHLRVAEILRGN